MAARGGTVVFQRSRGRWSRRHRERIPHERPLGILEFNPYGLAARRESLGTTVLAPTEAQLRTRGLVLAGLILAGSLGVGLLTAKVAHRGDEEGG